MPGAHKEVPSAEQLVKTVESLIERAITEHGSTKPINPGHRVPFHWPPHPVSHSFHVLSSDWDGKATIEHDDETYEVEVAQTPNGVFGRCPSLWLDARGSTLDEMLANLLVTAQPLFDREKSLQLCLGRKRRFNESFRELSPEDLLRLLYCPDRDIANQARIEIETHASLGVFGPALIRVLVDDRHPMRRIAQWCVLDIFEDLERICPEREQQERAVQAMKELLWNATDDYARTVYKAGVVLGGHIPAETGGHVLVECLSAPSKIGRRAAIHGLFHVVEWSPESRDLVVTSLIECSSKDSESALREFARAMAEDIQAGRHDHVEEPGFPEEAV